VACGFGDDEVSSGIGCVIFRHLLEDTEFIRRVSLISGLTCVSRVLGFFRDVLLAFTLGNSVMSDILFLSLRVPNHLRALLAEGAFNAAFIPTYSSIRFNKGLGAAMLVAGQVITALVLVQLSILFAAEFWMSDILRFIAPQFVQREDYGNLAVILNRITFPYLMATAMSTVFTGILHVNGHFSVAAGAPIFFNVLLILGVCLGGLFAGEDYTVAVSWGAAIGVCLSGAAQVGMLIWYCKRKKLLPRLAVPRLSPEMITFGKRLGPALLGSSSTQIAAIVDTTLAASLPMGAISALYYADRLYQLPIGIIAFAMASALLPKLAKQYSGGDLKEVRRIRGQAFLIGLIAVMPFAIVFVIWPELMIKIIFAHGMFKDTEALRSAKVLAAYGCGLPAMVLLRIIITSFHARGDTMMPMLIGMMVLVVNIAIKMVLVRYVDVSGLAIATSIGAWSNFLILWFIVGRWDRLDR